MHIAQDLYCEVEQMSNARVMELRQMDLGRVGSLWPAPPSLSAELTPSCDPLSPKHITFTVFSKSSQGIPNLVALSLSSTQSFKILRPFLSRTVFY